MNQRHILNEEKSDLVRSLVSQWLSITSGNPAKVQDLVDFLKSEKIQKVLPYNEEITDTVINQVVNKAVSKGYGDDDDEKKDKKSNTNPKKQEYVDRVLKIVAGLDKPSKKALLGMIS